MGCLQYLFTSKGGTAVVLVKVEQRGSRRPFGYFILRDSVWIKNAIMSEISRKLSNFQN